MMDLFYNEFLFDEEFQFALEMVILNRHEEGATLTEIRDDFEKYFGICFESIWGYKCWELHIRGMLTNCMVNISSQTLKKGLVLYYMNIDAADEKLSYNLTDNMAFVVGELDIDRRKVKEMKYANKKSQSRSTNSSNSAISLNSGESEDLEFYGHSIIGDDFFLDLVYKDLKYRKHTKSRVRQIGQCISGQTIHKALKTIPHVIDEMQYSVIINLGSVDLLQGRELIDMIVDMLRLNDMLCGKDIFPILTTVPPLGNQMHNKELERKRKAFNKFLFEKFHCIDIEDCFLNNLSQIMFELYQRETKIVSGTQRAIVPWNRSGRRRVVEMLKRKIPYIY